LRINDHRTKLSSGRESKTLLSAGGYVLPVIMEEVFPAKQYAKIALHTV
jgi:hypothetical protein